MTINTSLSHVIYEGDGVNVDFTYTFRIIDSSHLLVNIADADNENAAMLTKGVDYEVYGVGYDSGGWITTLDLTAYTGQPILPSGWKISINRVVPLLQETDIINQGAFYASTHEKFFDYVTMETQQLRDAVDRCPKTPITSGESGDVYLDIIEGLRDETEGFRDETQILRNETEGFRDETEDFRDEVSSLVNDVKINVYEGETVEKQNYADVPFILPLDLEATACFVDGEKLPTSYLDRISDQRIKYQSEYHPDLICGASYTTKSPELDVGPITDPIVPHSGVTMYPDGLRIFGSSGAALKYSGASFTAGNTGAVMMRFELGLLASPMAFFELNSGYPVASANNLIRLSYTPATSAIYLEMYNIAGVSIYVGTLATFTFIPGIFYEIELGWDLVSQHLYLFINGTLEVDHLLAYTYIRGDTTSGVCVLGNNYNATLAADIFVDTFAAYSQAIHTASYTPLPERIIWYPSGRALEIKSAYFDPSAVAEAVAAAGFADERAAAALISETNAAASEAAAAASELSAAVSEANASASAASAAGSASSAATSAGNALLSKNAAAVSEANAAASEASASASAVSAAGSASSAATSAGNASASAILAGNSASAAALSASNAASSAVSALSSANAASISATNAGVSETNAGISEANAGASAVSAAASAAAAEAAAMSGMYANVYDHNTDYNIQQSDEGALLRVDTTTGDIIMYLPLLSSLTDPGDFRVAVMKWSRDANRVLVRPSYPPDTINGSSADYILEVQYKNAVFVGDKETDEWAAITGHPALGNIVVQRFSGSPPQVQFTLTNDPGSLENTRIFVDGLYQQKNTYTVAGKVITFSVAPPAGTDNIEVFFGSIIAIGTPSDGSVSTIKIQDDAVTQAKLAPLSVGTPEIQDDAVTQAKLAPLSVGTPEIQDDAVTEIKLGNLSVSTAKIQNFAVNTAKLETSAVVETKLATAAVATRCIQANAVTEDKLAPLSVGTPEIQDDAVTQAKLAPLSVGTPEIQDDSVTQAKLAPLSVGTPEIQDLAITEDKLAPLSINYTKLQNSAVVYGKIAALSVDGGSLVDGAVTTRCIQAGAVTENKLADLSVTNGAIRNFAVNEFKLGDLSVATSKIQDGAVTDAKINTVNITKLRTTSSDLSPLVNTAIGTVGVNNGLTISNPAGIPSFPYQSFCSVGAAAQVLTATPALVMYSSIQLDNQSEFTAANYTFSPKVSGLYSIHAVLQFSNLTATTFFYLALMLNTVAVASRNHTIFTLGGVPVSHALTLTKLQYVTQGSQINFTAAATPNATSVAGPASSYLDIFKIA